MASAMVPADALKGCVLFDGFSPNGLQVLASIASEKTYPAGAPLFVEDMMSEALLILREGQVTISAKDASGNAVALGEMGAGEWMGELSLIGKSQRRCTATAKSPVVAIEFRFADFQRLFNQKPQTCMKLLLGILRQFTQKISDNREAFTSLVGRGASRA